MVSPRREAVGAAGISGRQAALTRDGGKSLKDVQPHLESGWVLTPLGAPVLMILRVTGPLCPSVSPPVKGRWENLPPRVLVRLNSPSSLETSSRCCHRPAWEDPPPPPRVSSAGGRPGGAPPDPRLTPPPLPPSPADTQSCRTQRTGCTLTPPTARSARRPSSTASLSTSKTTSMRPPSWQLTTVRPGAGRQGDGGPTLALAHSKPWAWWFTDAGAQVICSHGARGAGQCYHHCYDSLGSCHVPGTIHQ